MDTVAADVGASNEVPHVRSDRSAHSKDNDGLVETKVTGVLVHGHFFDTYVVEPQVAHDSNLSITCLHRTLMKLFRKGGVPKVLYLQVDGGSENKNQWMMSYLSLPPTGACTAFVGPGRHYIALPWPPPMDTWGASKPLDRKTKC